MNITWERKLEGVGMPPPIEDRRIVSYDLTDLIPDDKGNIADMRMSPTFLRSLCKTVDAPYSWIVSIPEDLAEQSMAFAVHRYCNNSNLPITFKVIIEEDVLVGFLPEKVDPLDPYFVASELGELGELRWKKNGEGFVFWCVSTDNMIEARDGDALQSMGQAWLPVNTSTRSKLSYGVYRQVCSNGLTVPVGQTLHEYVKDQGTFSGFVSAAHSDAIDLIAKMREVAKANIEIKEEDEIVELFNSNELRVRPFLVDLIYGTFRANKDLTQYGLLNAITQVARDTYEISDSMNISDLAGDLLQLIEV